MKRKIFFKRAIALMMSLVFVVSLCTFGVEAQTPAEKYSKHTPMELWGSVIPYNNMGDATGSIPFIIPYIAEDNPSGICAVIFPGGGYSSLSKTNEGSKIAEFLNSKGISAFVVYYRVTESDFRKYDYRAILSDGLRAVKYVRYNATEFGIDPDRIFTIGFSAGGHLTCMSATHYDFEVDDPKYTHDAIDAVSARPNAAAPCYAVASIEKSYAHAGTQKYFARGDKQLQHDYSAENSVTAETPPIFLWHTWDDTTVPVQNSIGFAAALAEKNIPCELHIYGSGKHGLNLAEDNPTAFTWPELLSDWVFRTLG